jgi:hypothetical protein
MRWVVVHTKGRRSLIWQPGGSPAAVTWNVAQRRAKSARKAGLKRVRIRRFADLTVGTNTKRR